jgi:uncharacterized protein YjiS (DUF1127 family)
MNFLATLFRRARKRSDISALMALDDHLLTDIGLTRSEVADMVNGGRRRSNVAHV